MKKIDLKNLLHKFHSLKNIIRKNCTFRAVRHKLITTTLGGIFCIINLQIAMTISAQNKFNKDGNIIFISNYPTFDDKGTMGNINGVSKYTFNLLSQLKSDIEIEDRKLIVIADVPDGYKPQQYEENGLLIVRCWKKDDPAAFRKIVSTLRNFKNVDNIFVHFEFNMYGDLLTTLKFPIFLNSLKKRNKNVTVLLHQVVENLGELSGHLNVKSDSIKMKILNLGIKKFYWAVLGIADKIIVHDLVFKERLSNIRRKSPVFIIPHGMIDNSEYCEIVDPRSRLGLKKNDFVILVFGFLTWYKGSDWIAQQFVNYYKKTKDDSIKLILAGGRSSNLKDRKFYQKYYFDLLSTIENYPNIIHTGFVPDDEVQDYYCASDVVIFPYRTHMSASGPFSLALSYDRPFLISKELSSVLETPDIKRVLQDLGIEKESPTFSLSKPGDLFDKISKLIASKKRRNLMSLLSKRIKEEREWGKTAQRFLSIIDA